MKWLIIASIWTLGSLFTYIMINRKEPWVMWLKYSIKHRYEVWWFKKLLASMDELNRTIFLSEWLEIDYWFKKYWFGRQFEKIVIRELEKLQK